MAPALSMVVFVIAPRNDVRSEPARETIRAKMWRGVSPLISTGSGVTSATAGWASTTPTPAA
eukprot:5037321-Prorocentrum_lima.AAC.1